MKKYIFYLTLISFFIHFIWFTNFNTINAGDWIFLHDEFSSKILTNLFVWLSHMNLGGFAISVFNFPFFYLYSILTNLFFSYDFTVRLIFLYPISFLSPIGMFFLIRKLTKNNFGSFIGSVFYSFNSFFLRLQLDWQTYSFVWAITPFIYLLYLKLYESKSLKNSIYFALLSTISMAYEPRITLIIFGILGFDFIFRTIFLEKINALRKFSFFFIYIILFFMLNLFWLILSFMPMEGIEYASPHQSIFANFYNLLNAFSVQHYTWCGHTVCEPFKNNFPLPMLLVLPLLAFSILIFKKSNKIDFGNILIFSFIALLGIFLSKQQGPPFGRIYEWSFYHIPLFNLFRESSKFFIIQGFALSILASYSITKILSLFKNKTVIYAIIILVILATFSQNWLNVATGKVGGMFKTKTINPDYFTIKERTIGNDYYRTLWIPRMNRFTYFDFNKPAISLVDTLQTNWQPFSSFRSVNYNWPQGNQIMGILSNNFSDFILDSSSIKYVFIPSDEYNETYRHYGPKEYFMSSTDQLKYLTKMDWNLTNVSVYENEGYYPHIYTPDTYHITQLDAFNDLTQNYDNQNDDKEYAFIFAENSLTEKNNDFYYNITDPFEGEKLIPARLKEEIRTNDIKFTEENTKLGDCNRYDNRSYEEIKLSKELSGGQLKITAKAHIACIYFPFNYTKNAIYILNITYKGDAPSFTIWQETPQEHIRFPAKKTSGWVTEQFQFKVNPETKTPALGLFAQGNGESITENYYANISITEIQLFEKLNIEKTQKSPEIDSKMINPTKYIVDVKNAAEPLIIVFSDSYHPEWKAYAREQGKTVNWIEAINAKSEKHFAANGWANGFAIENCKSECTITIYFRPQSYFYIGGIISLTTLAACISYLICNWKKDFFKRICWKVIDAIKDRRKFKYSYKNRRV